MAKNYTITEVVNIVSDGKDFESIADIGKRFPVLLKLVATVSAKAGDSFKEFMAYIPDAVTANKVNTAIKANIPDAGEQDVQEEVEQQDKKPEEPPKKRGRGRKPKNAEEPKKVEEKVEEVEEKEADKEEADDKYAGKKAMELYSICKKRGIKCEPRKPAKYYVELLNKADAEAEEAEVIKKEIKQTKETMELAPADRDDIKEQCAARLAVLQEFAPEEMSEDAIRQTIQEVIASLGLEAPSMKDKGKVMKELMPKVKGKADGGLVNKIVGEMLQS